MTLERWIDLRSFVAVWIALLLGFVTAMLMLRPMPMSDQAGNLLLILIGFLVAKFGTVVDFFFGSTKENKDKDDTNRAQAQTIATMAGAPPPPAPPERGGRS